MFGEGKYLFCGEEEKRRKKRRKTFGQGKFVEEKEKLLRVDGTGLKGSLRNL